MKNTVLFALVLLIFSCGNSPKPVEASVKIISNSPEGKVVTWGVDATSETDWVRIDLDSSDPFVLPETSPDWDLALRRVEIETREGSLTGEELWYDYDILSHHVSPRDQVWKLKTSQGKPATIKVLNYYDGNQSGGHYTLEVIFN